MNELTSDGYEYYAPIGYRLLPIDERALLLPTKPFKGQRGAVTPDVQNKARTAVKDIGNEDILGDIHSHPLKDRRDHLVFSIGDMFRLTVPEPDHVMAVVGNNEFLFGIRTRETRPSIYSFSQDEFCKFWYSQNGYSYEGIDPDKGELAIRTKGDASHWDINRRIAEAHHIVFYSGDYVNGLIKVFPIQLTSSYSSE